MGRRAMLHKRLIAAALIAALGVAPATAQFSGSYKFLGGVREAKGEVVTEMLNEPGTTIINARDQNSGEGALQIVVKRRDLTWLSFLLGKGANPNLRDNQGNTALITAAQLGFTDGARLLMAQGAAVNQANNSGETPLIVAVQRRDLASVRLLLANGADSARPDRIAGKSARDYAAEDRRSVAILKLLDETGGKKPAGTMGPSR